MAGAPARPRDHRLGALALGTVRGSRYGSRRAHAAEVLLTFQSSFREPRSPLMLGRSHATIGAAAGVVAAHLLGAESVLAAAFHVPGAAGAVLGGVGMAAVAGPVAGLAALLPDLDEPGSTLGGLLPRWWHHLTRGHRRSTHSLLAVGLVWAAMHYGLRAIGVSGFADELLTVLVVVGVVSHLAADAITDHGVPLFWPARWRLCLPLFSTGSWLEHAVVALAVVGALWWAYDLGAVVTLARGAVA